MDLVDKIVCVIAWWGLQKSGWKRTAGHLLSGLLWVLTPSPTSVIKDRSGLQTAPMSLSKITDWTCQRPNNERMDAMELGARLWPLYWKAVSDFFLCAKWPCLKSSRSWSPRSHCPANVEKNKLTIQKYYTSRHFPLQIKSVILKENRKPEYIRHRYCRAVIQGSSLESTLFSSGIQIPERVCEITSDSRVIPILWTGDIRM